MVQETALVMIMDGKCDFLESLNSEFGRTFFLVFSKASVHPNSVHRIASMGITAVRMISFGNQEAKVWADLKCHRILCFHLFNNMHSIH